jgi:MoaA/NifB/PqqE/SkfB family radical SAM enzyme
MARYQRSLWWAFNQFTNRISQDVAYKFDAGYCLPQRIIFCLTLRCNIKCKQCGIWRTENKKELTAEQWKKIMLELREWLGSYRLQIAGGEIFIREDIIDLVQFASKNDILIGIVSNGTLIQEPIARRLVDSGLGYLDISIDGLSPEVHDYIRGVKGVHEKALQAIRHVKSFRDRAKSDLSIALATVVMGPNIGELVDLVKWVQSEGLNGISLNPLGPACDADAKWYDHSELWPKKEELAKLESIMDQLVDMKNNGAPIMNSSDQLIEMKNYFRNPCVPIGSNCMVGVTNFLISCDGEIHFCFRLPAIGNLDQPFRATWRSEKAGDVRRQIKACQRECSPGNFIYRRGIFKEIERYLQFK